MVFRTGLAPVLSTVYGLLPAVSENKCLATSLTNTDFTLDGGS